jgi:hypothetical protein
MILKRSQTSSKMVTMLNPMKRPPFPPTAEMKSNQVLLGFVEYSMTVGEEKKTLRTAMSLS